MGNHLKNETSPYLLQHAENPVNWYPWCSEAFEKAKREDKPVFLSIGYSTCHWCHVMAKESFEDKTAAEILNKNYISVKVDREERPDIDSVYMSVCQAFTGSGGWPMSIFMTWDKKPFFAGTYFPARPRLNMPGFSELLNEIAEQWNRNRGELLRLAGRITASLKQLNTSYRNVAHEDFCRRAVKMFSDSFDVAYGGFGTAPKFPVPHNLLFLTLYAQRNDDSKVLEMVEKTLTQMRKGGIFDHIGGGFSRYSTDPYFLAPHFEKMLYDNALLIIAYASVYAVTKRCFYLDTAKKTAEYVLREMSSEKGGFYSAQDADSEGIEGKYYTFTLAEIKDVLGKEKGEQFGRTFDITENGNFEGVNIPNLLKCEKQVSGFESEIQKLYSYRKKRRRLHMDDKVLISWNSMMIAALSVLYRVTGNKGYLQRAVDTELFIKQNLSKGLQLYTSWRAGKRSEKSFLDDYAYYVAALMELYHSTLEKSYLDRAEHFCMEAVKRFYDHQNGGFYLSDSDSTELFMNPKETHDGAVPSGNSIMAYNLTRLYQLTENEDYRALAGKQIHFMSVQAQDYLMGYSMFLFAKLVYDNPPESIKVVLKNTSDLEKIKERLLLFANVIVVPQSREYALINDSTTFYVCRNHTCLAPSNEL